MTTSPKAAPNRPKPAKKATAGAGSTTKKSESAGRARRKRTATNAAIATELAPAVAIALLDKTEQSPGDPAPALECLAVSAEPSETSGKVRLQLLFENGAVLPVEMSADAGAALTKGLKAELPQK